MLRLIQMTTMTTCVCNWQYKTKPRIENWFWDPVITDLTERTFRRRRDVTMSTAGLFRRASSFLPLVLFSLIVATPHTRTHTFRNLRFAENSSFNYIYPFATRSFSFFRSFLSPKYEFFFSFHIYTRECRRVRNYFCHPLVLFFATTEVFRRSRESTEILEIPHCQRATSWTIDHRNRIMNSKMPRRQFSNRCWTISTNNEIISRRLCIYG